MNDADRKAFEVWCKKEYGFTTGLMQDEARAGWQACCEWRDSQVGEAFGYFKCNPDGWVDCAETDEGAIALYEAPPTAQINQQLLDALHRVLPLIDFEQAEKVRSAIKTLKSIQKEEKNGL